ncbi:NADP-dependent aryl-alcohol dehydrogenase [Novosphingobium marinum]|uniref:Aryl-alcohol dehydrogenase-like predicted oxidoreductase n=1 Tax=Novosphingobium marinum TaxID=1514948 RepID=A0A7Y9XVQ5_9SPHN|nr:aldo/keto reductase [Novosphingobium marinum]NYH94163.1 aryl-alcohol dehydrogenase-like predicted oxidoreductase [Novosphingobium marinum]GGC20082.1 NADP-dependent aryl-alcohol dehydrogenase [Novosphingobium marinum]
MVERHPSIAGLRWVFGGNVFGWTLDRDASFRILDAFYEAGGRMIDTAEGYSSWVEGNSGGESEAIIGEWLESRGVRADMRIGTKTNQNGEAGGLAADRVKKALEGSFERLRTDYVDLYYAHQNDPETPADEVVATFDELVKAGKARELGCSNFETARLTEFLDAAKSAGRHGFTVIQPLYNLVTREAFEGAMQDLCVGRDIAALPYFGLASGFLTGKYRSAGDWAGNPRAFVLDGIASDRSWAKLERLRTVASQLDATPAQVAFAWLNSRAGVAAPIASATSVEQVSQLAEATRLELSAKQRALLDG